MFSRRGYWIRTPFYLVMAVGVAVYASWLLLCHIVWEDYKRWLDATLDRLD